MKSHNEIETFITDARYILKVDSSLTPRQKHEFTEALAAHERWRLGDDERPLKLQRDRINAHWKRIFSDFHTRAATHHMIQWFASIFYSVLVRDYFWYKNQTSGNGDTLNHRGLMALRALGNEKQRQEAADENFNGDLAQLDRWYSTQCVSAMQELRLDRQYVEHRIRTCLSNDLIVDSTPGDPDMEEQRRRVLAEDEVALKHIRSIVQTYDPSSAAVMDAMEEIQENRMQDRYPLAATTPRRHSRRASRRLSTFLTRIRTGSNSYARDSVHGELADTLLKSPVMEDDQMSKEEEWETRDMPLSPKSRQSGLGVRF